MPTSELPPDNIRNSEARIRTGRAGDITRGEMTLEKKILRRKKQLIELREEVAFLEGKLGRRVESPRNEQQSALGGRRGSG